MKKLNRIRKNIFRYFHPNVVEAYWLGNTLLDSVSLREFAGHVDTLGVKKKLSRKRFMHLMNHFDNSFPHHSWHVLNLFMRTGKMAVPQTLETMDSCRIGWGKVKSINTLDILTQPLVYEKNKLQLGKPIIKNIQVAFGKYTPGDIVTYHWGVVCEKISAKQVKQLEYYTQRAIDAANIAKI